MKRIVVAVALALSVVLSCQPVNAQSHHRHGRVRVCHLVGIGVTDGGDTPIPDDNVWTYLYRCSDGSRYEVRVIVPD